MCGVWGLVSLGSLHVGEVIGKGLAASSFFPIPVSLLIHSLDLSELAKAAKKKLQAVSLLRQAPNTWSCSHF